MKILRLIRKKLSWSNTKLSELIYMYREICTSYRGELTIRSWELKGWIQHEVFACMSEDPFFDEIVNWQLKSFVKLIWIYRCLLCDPILKKPYHPKGPLIGNPWSLLGGVLGILNYNREGSVHESSLHKQKNLECVSSNILTKICK